MLIEKMHAGVLAGDRRWLAKAITLVESQRGEDRVMADELLQRIFLHTGKSFRIGVTGVPGVGKSTFIEALSLHILAEAAKKIAVLSIDPSSPTQRGSVLADKTRMVGLSRRKEAFIRPSPTNQVLGGVAAGTREALLLCEAAGYEVIFVETVGVGQGEVLVKDMVDVCILLLLGGAGDELQGIKKGILEIADIFLLHKVESEDSLTTRKNLQLYKNILQLNKGKRYAHRTVMACSSLRGDGIARVWEQLQRMAHTMRLEKSFDVRRREQEAHWLHHYLRQYVVDALYGSMGTLLQQKEQEVRERLVSAQTAARDILLLYRSGS